MTKEKENSIKLIIIGFVLLAIGVVVAGSVSYQTSMREKIPITISLSNRNLSRYQLPQDLSMKTFYNFSYIGNRYVNLSIIFLNKDSLEIGRLTVNDTSKNSSGYLYLDDTPDALLIKNDCEGCNTTIFLTFYFAKYNSSIVNIESLLSTIFSVAGATTLLMGGYMYTAYKNKEKSNPSRSFPEGREQQLLQDPTLEQKAEHTPNR